MRLIAGLIVAAVLWVALLWGDPERSVDQQGGSQAAYWTFDTLEPDTLACAWLLQYRLVPPARVEFVPRGQVGTGIPFDMPLVRLSRTYDCSSFGVLLDHLEVNCAELARVRQLINEIELSSWSDEPGEHAQRLEEQLRRVIDSATTAEEALCASRTVFQEIVKDSRE